MGREAVGDSGGAGQGPRGTGSVCRRVFGMRRRIRMRRSTNAANFTYPWYLDAAMVGGDGGVVGKERVTKKGSP